VRWTIYTFRCVCVCKKFCLVKLHMTDSFTDKSVSFMAGRMYIFHFVLQLLVHKIKIL
jgi:hypothetical protein